MPTEPILRVGCWGLGLFCLMTGAPALAQTEAPDTVERAVELGHRAKAAFDRGDAAEAYETFRAAEALAHSPVFRLYTARSLRHLGRWTEAREWLEHTANETLAADAPPAWVEARRHASSELESLDRELPRLTLSVQPGPGPLAVTLDGLPLELPVVRRALDPGKHAVVVRRGATARRFDFDLAPGADHRLEVEVERERSISAEPAPRTTRSDAGTRAASTGSGWVWGAFAASGASLLVGTTTGAWAYLEARELGCRRCPTEKANDVRHAQRLADVSTWSFVVAGAAAATGIGLLLFTEPSRENATTSRVELVLQGSALGVRGEL